MALAHNPETGEYRILKDGQWVPTRVAKNDKTGEIAVLDGQKWVKVEDVPREPERSGLDSGVVKTMTPVNQGIARVLGGVGDLESLIAAGMNWVGEKVTGKPVGATNLLPTSQDVQQKMESAGVPFEQAESRTGRVLQEAGAGITEATLTLPIALSGLAVRGGKSLATVLDDIAKNFVPAAVTGGGAGAGAEVGGQISGENPVYRLLGGLAGGVTAATTLAPRAVRATRGVRNEVSDEAILQQVKESGIDISALPPKAKTAITEEVRKRMASPKASAARAQAETLPVPLQVTRAQSTGFEPDMRFELNARQGVYGDHAARTMKNLDDANQRKLAQNAEVIQNRMGGPGSGQSELVQGRLSAMEEAARKTYQQSYRAAQDLNISMPVDIANRVVGAAESAIKDFHPTSSAQARQIIEELKDEISQSSGTVPFSAINARIKQLKNVAGGNIQKNADETAAMLAGNNAEKALFDISAADLPLSSQDAIQAWNRAKGAYKEWAQVYKKSTGNAPNIVQKLTERTRYAGDTTTKVEPEDVMGKIFGGKRGVRGSVRDARLLKEQLGPDSEEWNAVRESGWMRLVDKATGEATMEGGRMFSGPKFAKALDDAMTQNRALMEELYSPEELAVMKQFRDVAVRVTKRPEYSTAAQSANAVINIAKSIWDVIPIVPELIKSGYGNVKLGRNMAKPTPRDILMSSGGKVAAGSPLLYDILEEAP